MELYILPAYKRAEDFKQSNNPPAQKTAQTGPDGQPGSPLHRMQVVYGYMNGPVGLSRKKAEALYDEQLAEWKAAQAGLE